MCGLVGVFGDGITQNEANIFRWMLLLDVIRGEHSTGACIVYKQRNIDHIKVAKAVSYPSRLFERYYDIFERTGRTRAAFNRVDRSIQLMMGHNRQATIGAVNTDNCHPFNKTNLVGAHNGTIRDGLDDITKGLVGDTDSEQLFQKLSTTGNLEETLDGVYGAAALTYYTKASRELTLYRNAGRPLWTVTSKRGDYIMWASEPWMLTKAIERTRSASQFNHPVKLPEDTFQTFVVKGIRVEKIREGKVVLEATKPHVYSTRYQSGYYDQGNYPNVVGFNRVPAYPTVSLLGADYKPALAANREVVDDEIPFGGGDYSSDTGWYLVDEDNNTEEIEKFLKNGCQVCQANLSMEDQKNDQVRWMQRDTPLCLGCAGEFKVA